MTERRETVYEPRALAHLGGSTKATFGPRPFLPYDDGFTLFPG
ncbi:hypothetical protein [Streptomyces sp. NPDC003077]